MPLDQEIANRLWEDRYEEQLRNFAWKNKYLNEFSDPEDLFQDMAIHVWLKAINNFNTKKVTFSTDVERSFNSFLTTIMNQYFANLAASRESGKSRFFRTKVKQDRPLSSEDEGGATLLDMVPDDRDLIESLRADQDFDGMVMQIDPELSEILKFIVAEYQPGRSGILWEDVRNKFGKTRAEVMNALLEEDAFVDYLSHYSPEQTYQ